MGVVNSNMNSNHCISRCLCSLVFQVSDNSQITSDMDPNPEPRVLGLPVTVTHHLTSILRIMLAIAYIMYSVLVFV